MRSVVGRDVHIFRAVLRRAGAESVQTEREGVGGAAAVVVVFAAGVEFAENELPVVPLFFLVVAERNAATEVLDLDRPIEEDRDDNGIAETLARLVDGVRQDLEEGVFASLEPVGTEDDGGATAHPVGALELRDALVVILGVVLLFGRHGIPLLRHVLRQIILS